MRGLFLFALACSVWAQNPNTSPFPTTPAADTDLYVANDRPATQKTLNGGINSSTTTVVLSSGSPWKAPLVLTACSVQNCNGGTREVMHCAALTTDTLTGCVRGQEGTAANSFSSGAYVYNFNTAYQDNQKSAEIKAIEACLLGTTACSISINGAINVTDTAHSGADYFRGLTSGGVAIAVADVAGTAIVYVLPSTNGTAGQVLTDSGSTTCPTLATGLPTTCHLLAWASAGAGDFSSNTSSSVDSEFVLFSSTGGKTGKRATGTGLARSTSGVYSAAELSGDATTSGSNVVTVVKVNGIAHSATAAAHSIAVITTANTTATQKTLPDCQDTGGNHLNFTQSTDAFSCGTSGSGGGSGCTVLASSSDYITPGFALPQGAYADNTTNLATPNAAAANQIFVFRVFIPCAWTPNKIGAFFTTGCAASSHLSFGVYNSALSKIVDSGVLTPSTAVPCSSTGAAVLTSSTTPAATGMGTQYAAGWYVLAMTSDETTARLSGFGNSGGSAGVTGASGLINAITGNGTAGTIGYAGSSNCIGGNVQTSSAGALPSTLNGLCAISTYVPTIALAY